jgi:hypothetical protein
MRDAAAMQARDRGLRDAISSSEGFEILSDPAHHQPGRAGPGPHVGRGRRRRRAGRGTQAGRQPSRAVVIGPARATSPSTPRTTRPGAQGVASADGRSPFRRPDQFKSLSNTHGHCAGDGLLIAVANRLARPVRPGPSRPPSRRRARVLCEDLDRQAPIHNIAERIVAAPFALSGTTVEVTATTSSIYAKDASLCNPAIPDTYPADAGQSFRLIPDGWGGDAGCSVGRVWVRN